MPGSAATRGSADTLAAQSAVSDRARVTARKRIAAHVLPDRYNRATRSPGQTRGQFAAKSQY